MPIPSLLLLLWRQIGCFIREATCTRWRPTCQYSSLIWRPTIQYSSDDVLPTYETEWVHEAGHYEVGRRQVHHENTASPVQVGVDGDSR